MNRRLVLFGAVILAGSGMPSACARRAEDEDLKPPPGFRPPPVRALQAGPPSGRLGFGSGFWPIEFSNEGKSWHWMAERGEIRLPNDRRPRKLRIVGWLPTEFLDAPPTIRISIGNHLADSFVGSKHELDRAYVVNPDLLGDAPSVLLIIETSSTARIPGDTRDLGVSIETISWEGGS